MHTPPPPTQAHIDKAVAAIDLQVALYPPFVRAYETVRLQGPAGGRRDAYDKAYKEYRRAKNAVGRIRAGLRNTALDVIAAREIAAANV